MKPGTAPDLQKPQRISHLFFSVIIFSPEIVQLSAITLKLHSYNFSKEFSHPSYEAYNRQSHSQLLMEQTSFKPDTCLLEMLSNPAFLLKLGAFAKLRQEFTSAKAVCGFLQHSREHPSNKAQTATSLSTVLFLTYYLRSGLHV